MATASRLINICRLIQSSRIRLSPSSKLAFSPTSSLSTLDGTHFNKLLKVNSVNQKILVHERPFSLSNADLSSSKIPESIWKLGRFNHVAIAVPDLEKATSFYRDALNAKVSAPQELPEHGVTTVFIELDNTKLELLHPLGDKSPIQKFLEKNKSGGLHHICIEVNDIKAAMSDVTKSGIRCLGKEPKIGAHGKPVIFLHPVDCNGVLLELEEA